ncbi:AraC family transcriptional regulator [Lentzea jiangxiensis]|uniref:AraC-type DNA-binding protein n=1 Tax=Lentzea jiangxiensis TaxID=641025 RepID=A0A1H0TRJ6_9PSEU|nr:AraC family transcriptional regulator [Lentzea jiangxiensis]SDP56657.1 AraC-type DNA-binding protein [Lentzea jiangxiensis]
MTGEDIFSGVMSALRASCILAGHRSGSGDWLIQSPPPGRVKILAVTRGQIKFRLGNEPEWLEAAAGEALVLDGRSPFVFGTKLDMAPTQAVLGEQDISPSPDDETVCVTAHIDLRGGGDLFLQQAVPAVTHVSAESNAGPAIGWLLRQLDVEMKHRLPGSHRASEHILEILFIHVMREWLSAGLTLPAGWIHLFADPVLSPAVRLIHHERKFALSVGELARACGLSRTVFIEKFRESAGIPPASYVLQWKMQLALSLLETTEMSVDQIARHLEYSSSSAFNVAFKRSTGRSPGSLRKAGR